MNATPSDVVASILVASGLAYNPTPDTSWPIYVGRWPDTEDTAILVSDSPEDATDGKDMRSKERIVHFGFQVMVRVPRVSYGRGLVHAGKLFRQCETTRKETVSIADYDDSELVRSYLVSGIRCPNGVRYIGAGEDDERHHFAFDAFLTAKEVI